MTHSPRSTHSHSSSVNVNAFTNSTDFFGPKIPTHSTTSDTYTSRWHRIHAQLNNMGGEVNPFILIFQHSYVRSVYSQWWMDSSVSRLTLGKVRKVCLLFKMWLGEYF
mmetsp:Transcript_28150/g.28543  ORF Transcript_28150/g.28543 Transcript_28150/m.28543 type:complete len:108 (-) Transcript_28150:7-330(-)